MNFGNFNLYDFGTNLAIAGLVFSDEKCSYFFPIEPGTPEVKHTIEMTIDDWKALIRQTDLGETQGFAKDEATGKLQKVILRKSERQIDQMICWSVYKRDGYRCRYCGRETALTVDHVDLWENGGASVADNLVSSCRRCNKLRGNEKYQFWIRSQKYAAVSAGIATEVAKKNLDLIAELPRLETLRDQRKNRSR